MAKEFYIFGLCFLCFVQLFCLFRIYRQCKQLNKDLDNHVEIKKLIAEKDNPWGCHFVHLSDGGTVCKSKEDVPENYKWEK